MESLRLVCLNEANLTDEQQAELRCEIDGEVSLDGAYEGNKVTCCGPEESLPKHVDPEANEGLRCRIFSKDALIHEGTAVPLLSGVDAVGDNTTLAPTSSSTRPALGIPQKSKKTFKQKYGALYPFAIISVSYLLFTITDGAVRMIVLLHAYQQQFTPLDVAIMFSMYEAAGIVTNLAAGMLGARWGIKTSLLAGLTIQLFGLGMLFGWQEDWSKAEAILYVTASQMLCGIAKDLTKLGGKTVTKLVTPEGKNSSLFKLVSFITGWKNSLKGAGYFLGAATVGINYYMSLGILCGLVLAAMPWAIVGLSNQLGRTRKENVSFSQLFNNNRNINVLSLSRVFLFGSRDLWFEVPLPFFLRSAASGIGWSRALTGAFLAIFIIVYGQVQSWTPQLVLQPLRQSPPDKYGAFWWASSLVIPLSILGGIMLGTDIFGPGVPEAPAIVAITVLLYSYCVLFAFNSAIHSYLIVRYSEGDKVAMQVGAYYASNALGRLTGTILSGVLYTYAGDTDVERFGVCLFASVLFAMISTAVDAWLEEDSPGSWWLGPFNRCLTDRKSKEKLKERLAAKAVLKEEEKKEKEAAEDVALGGVGAR
ncbi:hypothetical protein Ndes2526B_g07519 [Nannochloris sp. 'desiccata']|nr:hypothetical protein KSW81_001224 [Chlorella desiccata (nom. nud.)]KAH7617654.1 hypothetical protein NADE_004060 [Chlorella desiccata (nom. nud.)]